MKNMTCLLLVIAALCGAGSLSADPSTDLMGAVIMGSVDDMKTALKAGAKINYRDPKNQGRTALMIAVQFGKDDKIAFLLSRKADVKVRSDDGRTALFYAVEAGQVDVIAKLLTAGADANARDAGGAVPLSYCPRMNVFEKEPVIRAARKLLAARAKVNVADKEGDTPLMAAVRAGITDLADLLIKKGALVKAKNKMGRTALMDAKINEDAPMIELLKKAGAVDFPSLDDDLYLAVKHNDTDAAARAIKSGAMVKSPRFNYLRGACASGNSALVRLLIDSGAEVNSSSESGETALHSAVSFKQVEAVKLLVDAGADVNLTTRIGNTPLVLAAQNMSDQEQYREIVAHLIRGGARLNDKGDKGMTALMWASGQGMPVIVRQLIEAGADVNMKDPNGMTALMFAANYSQKESVEALIKAGAKINEQDNSGWSALHHAIKGAFEPVIVNILVPKGADVNMRAKGGWTPLMEAASRGKPEIVAALVKAGADVNAESEEGRTALGYASFMVIDDPESPFRKIVEMLKKAGAK